MATRPLTGDPDETFQYDPVGNRISRDGQVMNSVFNDANRLLEDDQFTYAYDLSGNILQKTDSISGEVTDYTWDVLNQLVKVEQRPSLGGTPIKTVQYQYDPLGRRILKDVDGVLIKYVYDGPDILLEYSGVDVLQARYTHGLSTDEPLVVNRGGIADYFYHTDDLGSVTELTDSTGNIVQSYAYDSFGNVRVFDHNGAIISIENGIVNPFTYTGREFDTETGLYYYRSRYYDSNIGRFISEDPIDFSGGDNNLYGYVSNDPINLTDPSGLVPVRQIPCGESDRSACVKICSKKGGMLSCAETQKRVLKRARNKNDVPMKLYDWKKTGVICKCNIDDDGNYCSKNPIICGIAGALGICALIVGGFLLGGPPGAAAAGAAGLAGAGIAS
jgi:RHS repeat-associated protein